MNTNYSITFSYVIAVEAEDQEEALDLAWQEFGGRKLDPSNFTPTFTLERE